MENEARLRARLQKLKEKKATAVVNKTEATSEIRRLDKDITRIKTQLTKETGRKVTDHAIVRYMERIMGICQHKVQVQVSTLEKSAIANMVVEVVMILPLLIWTF